MKKKSLMKRIRSGNTIYPDDSLVTRFYRQENCEMKLKKINAALGLLSILFILIHMGYNVFAYLTFYYNPVLSKMTAVPFMILVCLHAVCGMLVVFLQKDGSRMDLYPKQNLQTILQRASAALIFPLLILHINTFAMMREASEKGNVWFIVLLLMGELLFFAVVITHVAVSFTKGFITLGLLSSDRLRRKLDGVIYVVGAVCFLVASFVIMKGQIGMFLMG